MFVRLRSPTKASGTLKIAEVADFTNDIQWFWRQISSNVRIGQLILCVFLDVSNTEYSPLTESLKVHMSPNFDWDDCKNSTGDMGMCPAPVRSNDAQSV